MRKTLMMCASAMLVLQGCANSPGQYASSVMESPEVQRLIQKGSCDGQGLQSTEVSVDAFETPHSAGYQVIVKMRGECARFNGQIMLPKGVTRNGVGPQDQRQRMPQEQGGHLW